MKNTVNYKIVFTGPVGAGKTTAIAALSDVPPVSTDEAATDMTIKRKNSTTVALDYGLMRLPDGARVHLYGTPGQERFDFMWDILIEGGIGLVLLLDGSRASPEKDLQFFLKAFKDFISSTGIAIGVTRLDELAQPSVVLDRLHAQIRNTGLNPPVFSVDARDKRDVRILVKALLYAIDPEISDAAA